MAAATGLMAGTPIVAGMADQVAGFIGAGITQPNRMADNAGTFPVIALCTDSFKPDMKNQMAEILPSPIPGYWNPVSYIIGGGLTHHWFQETFAHADELTARDAGNVNVYEVLDEMARTLPPGSEKLFFNPHLGGRACPNNTDYRGSWFGFSWTHRREHFYRAILEAIAYDQFLMYQSLQESYPEADVQEVTAYGGGSKSGLWNQIKADVMGVPYVCLGRDDVAAVGNAILAGYTLGIFDDMTATSERFMQRSTRYEPDPAAHQLYRQYAAFYAELLAHTEPAYADLAALPFAPALNK
jgi:xylulokinase